jgi:virginiamycin B lyase
MTLKRTLLAYAGAAVAAALLGGCGNTTPITSGSPTPQPAVTPRVSSEYPVPTLASEPAGITKGSNGDLWFTEEAGDNIGQLSQTAVVTEYSVPTANAQPLSIASGSDGNLWFTESAVPQIGRISTSGTETTEFTLPNPAARPSGITSGPDGALWVTDPGANGIWRVTTSGVASFYPIATPKADPTSITTGPNGALWFTETAVDKIGEIYPSAAAGSSPTEFPVSAGAGLGTIVSGTDDALWFTESKSDKLGRMLTTGVLTAETPLPGVTEPQGLVLAPNGNFYIADSSGSLIASYAPSTGTVVTYPTITKAAQPFQLAIGADGEVYFTEYAADKIGQFRYF